MKSTPFFSLLPLPWLLCLSLFLFGCASGPADCARLPGGGSYCLQATSLIAPFEVQQQVGVRYRDKQDTMIASIENDAQHLDFVGLTPFGQKLIHFRYANQQATVIQTPDSRIQPAMMLALLQLALWPVDAVEQGLDHDSSIIVEGTSRIVTHRDRLVMQVEYHTPGIVGGDMHITLPQAELILDIKRLDMDTLNTLEPGHE